MSRINTNVSSLLAQQNLSRTNDQLQQSLERLSTGLRINSGKDDPAGLIASEALQSDIVSTQQAVSNSQTADQMINTADSALGQIGTLLNNIRGLITASANQGAMSSDQLAANQLQVDSSLDAINRIAETTNFQNQRLLDGSLGFQTTGTTNFSSANNIDIQQAQLVGNAGQAVNVNVTSAASQASLALNVPDAAGPISQASGSLTLNNGAAAQATGTDTLSAGSATQATGTVTLNSVAATLTAVPGGALDGAAGNQTFTVDLAFGQASAGATLSGTTLTVNVTAASGTATLKDVESAIHTSAATTGLDATVVNADSATTVSTADSGASAALANGADAVPTTFALNALAGGALDGAAGNQTYTVNLAFSQASAGASLSGTTLTVNLTAASGTATLKDVESAIHGSAATTGLDATVVNGDSATTVTSAESGTTATLTNGADATPAALTLSAVANGALDGLAGNGTYTVDLVFGANSAGATLSGKTLTVSVTQASGTATLSNIQSAIHGARGTTGIDAAVSTGGSDTVSSRNSGQTAVLANGAPAATAAGLQKDVTFSLTGDQGTQTFSFTAGTLIAQVQNAIHALADATGVDATLTNATTLTLNSTDSGSAAFVDLKVLSEAAGGTIATDLGGSSSHQLGTNFAGTINGVQANGDGQSLSVDTAALSMKMGVASGFTGAIAFNIDSGGALFQIGANVVSDSQARIGIQKVTTDSLGGVDGTLSNISSQGSADLAKDPATASKIVNEAIAEVSSLRGRLGAFQQATLETNITTLNDSITNLTSAQSSIQDADFAAESANVTRAQVLAQSGTAVLAIANKSPQNVLTLLQGL